MLHCRLQKRCHRHRGRAGVIMVEGKTYRVTLTDGETVIGVYIGAERGFFLLRVGSSTTAIRPSSIKTKPKVVR